jgi:SAM-dependent methyltransferase
MHGDYARSAEYYDLIYEAAGKDYARESQHVHALIQRNTRTRGRALLDVACGTGGHLAYLREQYTVEGLDLSPEMLAIARKKHPDVVLHRADLTSFDLGRRFDAVVCLFSAIAYAHTVAMLHQAVRTMARHLHPGGVLIVEPFIRPEDVIPDHVGAVLVDRPDLKVARVNVSRVAGRVVSLHFHYLVATPGGVEHFTERHDLAVFTVEEYLAAFRDAGLEATFDPEGLMGRGLYVGLKPLL